jgi:hypothetical protein
MRDIGVRQTSSSLVFWSPVLNGRMKQCQKNLSCGENARANINIRVAQMNRLIVDKIQEWTECSQSLYHNQNGFKEKIISRPLRDEKL